MSRTLLRGVVLSSARLVGVTVAACLACPTLGFSEEPDGALTGRLRFEIDRLNVDLRSREEEVRELRDYSQDLLSRLRSLQAELAEARARPATVTVCEPARLPAPCPEARPIVDTSSRREAAALRARLHDREAELEQLLGECEQAQEESARSADPGARERDLEEASKRLDAPLRPIVVRGPPLGQ